MFRIRSDHQQRKRKLREPVGASAFISLAPCAARPVGGTFSAREEQGPQRKYAGYLSTTFRKVKVSGSRNSRVIGEMVRREMKRMEKSKRSEATLTACMDDHGMNEDSNLSHSVRASKRGKQSRDDDTN